MRHLFGYLLLLSMPLAAQVGQEAEAGIDIRATISGEGIYSRQLTESPRNGTALDGAFRAVVYPLIKLNRHWWLDGAVQFDSAPFFTEDFSAPGHSVTTQILRASLGYKQTWNALALTVRAGQLGSIMGDFNLRYDDAVNPLIDMPILYGYYAKISPMGVAGVEADVTDRNWDAHAQFVNSSMMNPRSVFDRDQYGNWVGDVGYTILQGLRVGASAGRGPYLDRHWPFYVRGEANPNVLPGSSAAADVEFGYGHWDVHGEWDWMLMSYHAIPFTRREGSYVEVKRGLAPRWYAALRAGYLTMNRDLAESYEVAAGFRPNTRQIIKLSYEIQHDDQSGQTNRAVMVQLVTTIHPLSLAWDLPHTTHQ
jgi:hypothetical protein